MLSKRKTDIELAFDMLRSAINLSFDYLFDENGIPLEKRLNSFNVFVDELLRSYCATHSVSKNMHNSFKAGQESPPNP
jgi:hypothetical protein